MFFMRALSSAGIGGGFAAVCEGVGDFCEAEVENFCVAAFGDEDVGGLDVAVDDAGAMSGVESVGDFDAESRSRSISRGRPVMACLRVAPSRNSMAMKARSLSSPMS